MLTTSVLPLVRVVQNVGAFEGEERGKSVGELVAGVGNNVGLLDGANVGFTLGEVVGMLVGYEVGLLVGYAVVGLNVGGNVGSGVYFTLQIVHCGFKFCDPTINA